MNTIYTSTDGVTWTPHTVSDAPATISWSWVAKGGTLIGVLGADPSSNTPYLARSTDGSNFSATQLAGFNPIQLGFDGNAFIVVYGYNAAIGTTTDLVDVTIVGTLEVPFRGLNGMAFNATTSPPRLVGVGGASLIVTFP